MRHERNDLKAPISAFFRAVSFSVFSIQVVSRSYIGPVLTHCFPSISTHVPIALFCVRGFLGLAKKSEFNLLAPAIQFQSKKKTSGKFSRKS